MEEARVYRVTHIERIPVLSGPGADNGATEYVIDAGKTFRVVSVWTEHSSLLGDDPTLTYLKLADSTGWVSVVSPTTKAAWVQRIDVAPAPAPPPASAPVVVVSPIKAVRGQDLKPTSESEEEVERVRLREAASALIEAATPPKPAKPSKRASVSTSGSGSETNSISATSSSMAHTEVTPTAGVANVSEAEAVASVGTSVSNTSSSSSVVTSEEVAKGQVQAAVDGGDWDEGYSEKYDRRFWKNRVTGEKTWKNPFKAKPKAKETDDVPSGHGQGQGQQGRELAQTGDGVEKGMKAKPSRRQSSVV